MIGWANSADVSIQVCLVSEKTKQMMRENTALAVGGTQT